MVSFLAAFDNMIVASNTPLAFLLTASTSQPLYGKWVDMFGRRTCFLFATCCYLVGAILCGAAQAMVMLIVARALCGLGIGAFDTLMKIIVADYIPVRYIGLYQALLGISWGLGYVAGALLGKSWRWLIGFWFSCVVALVLVFISIERPTTSTHWRQHVARIDFVGIVLWSVGVVCMVLGLSWGGTTYAWDSPIILCLICISVVIMVLFGVWEYAWASDPLVPRGVFSNRSSILILLAAFLYGGCFQSLMTYTPLYLSVIRKEDSMTTNLLLLCLVLFACICNVLTGFVIVKTGRYTWATRFSLVVLTLACGLLNLLRTDSTTGLIVGLMIVTGIGSGAMINSSIITAQASVSIEHVPSMVAFMTFCDQVGGITGITMTGSILSNTLKQNVDKLALPGVSADMVRQSSAYLWQLPLPIRSLILNAYMDSVRMSFWGSTALAATGLLVCIGLKSYVMRTRRTEGEKIECVQREITVNDKHGTPHTLELDNSHLKSTCSHGNLSTVYDIRYIYGISTNSDSPQHHRDTLLGVPSSSAIQWEQVTLTFFLSNDQQSSEALVKFAQQLRQRSMPKGESLAVTRVYVFLNPVSGSRKGPQVWNDLVRPMLVAAGFQESRFQVVPTSGNNRTRSLAEKVGAQILAQDHQEVPHMVICIGGDGTVHDVVNGLSDAFDKRTLPVSSFRLGVVPAGSGNAFALGLGISAAEQATLHIIHQRTSPFRLMDVSFGSVSPASEQDPWYQHVAYDTQRTPIRILVVMSWGFHAEIVSKARYLQRWMGNRRFSLVALYLALFLKHYPGELVLIDAQRRHNGAFQPPCTVQLSDKPFTYFLASKQPSLEPGFKITPFASHASDDMDVIMMRQISAARLKEISIKVFQGGRHVDEEAEVEYYKATEMVLRVKDGADLCLDGEIYPIKANHVVRIKTIGPSQGQPNFETFVA
ncbi:ATP-NAD kinase-like domain-containing protein [Radiomyces spectabilis]|uniref:ATP-NAD kinase-like domain-containing protein n=1 Tax=Radiomyces spectabilis TaxID=64574 RepID=UPI00221EB88D|nr:ATP-NAD kinase-like domain-containing protein [Radiomyces spectabilis]KAI8384247.1 ATP-NAD kinase-like domain-containing protein [Radiomyces spectabilis]